MADFTLRRGNADPGCTGQTMPRVSDAPWAAPPLLEKGRGTKGTRSRLGPWTSLGVPGRVWPDADGHDGAVNPSAAPHFARCFDFRVGSRHPSIDFCVTAPAALDRGIPTLWSATLFWFTTSRH
jgi:hypothetical protein